MNEKEWCAVFTNNTAYDDLFFYGVSTTLIYCRPSCRSKTPLRKHVSIFVNQTDAISAGYRPCKRCRPDKTIVISSQVELVHQTVEYVNTHLSETLTLASIADKLFVSSTYLQKIFKGEMKESPSQYVISIRLEKAKALLQTTNTRVIDIANSIGYVNAGHFATVFQRHVGQSPTQYRSQSQTKENPHYA
jgi:AraC family transcriptional regulator of adaptative response / methylphosphotriester-DNA alkyltransferase methyltransferase